MAAGDTSTQTPAQEMSPVATLGYGARESSDAKRQASDSQRAHDEPESVNFNEIATNSQALTIDVLGKEFTSNTDRREKISAANDDWREIHKGRLFGAKKDA